MAYGVTQQMIDAYGEVIFKLSLNKLTRLGDPVRELDFEKIAARVPLGRVGGASDMAGVCLFLASPAAAWISGAIVPVDGGHLARGLDLPAGED